MEKEIDRVAIYPGCSLEGTASGFDTSLKRVLAELDLDLKDMSDWSCCGATSAHALDHSMYLGLALRNLSLAEAQGCSELLAPCAACYHRLASANKEFSEDSALLDSVATETDMPYGGSIKVRNVLDFLANIIGTDRISSKVKNPLEHLKVASYYGCLNTRVPRMKPFDDAAYPMSMDRIIESIGARALDWEYKTECCGASLFVTSESTATRLVAKILKDAEARGADCIAVACPMCHNNLDTKQADIRQQYGIEKPIPVLFVTQLMGLAFGMTESELQLGDSFVPFQSIAS